MYNFKKNLIELFSVVRPVFLLFFLPLILLSIILLLFRCNDYNKKLNIQNNCVLENNNKIEKYQLECIDRSSKSTGFLKTNSYIDKCQKQAIEMFCGKH